MSEKHYLFGIHPIEALLKKQPSRISQLMILKERCDPKIQMLIDLAKPHEIEIQWLPRYVLDQKVNNENHQGIIAVCQKARIYSEHDLEKILIGLAEPAFLLILDGVQDPHNLGACLRSADAAGVHAVIAPKDKSVGLTPTVSKVASGAAETVPFVQVTNLARTMRFLKENHIWIFGAVADTEKTLYDADYTVPLALVLGAEGAGIRRLTREHCDLLLNIPMSGSVSSLNVSVATGIFLFEAVRQRRYSKS